MTARSAASRDLAAVIGLEVHVQLETDTKIFCGCSTEPADDEAPNSRTCPTCLGLPGSLPVLNEGAVEAALKVGKALGSEIPEETRFHRKNYYYPDLPKDFQITQYDAPICDGGGLAFGVDGERRTVGIERAHLEEDPGSLTHAGGSIDTADHTLIDYNRAGTPLLEIVTAPEFRSGTEARAFLAKLTEVLEYLGVFDATRDGSLRVDANLSIVDADALGGDENDDDVPGGDQYADDVPGDENDDDVPGGNANDDDVPGGDQYDDDAPGGDTNDDVPGGDEVDADVLADANRTEVKNISSHRAAEKALAYEETRQKNAIERGRAVEQETRHWDESRGITVSMRTKEAEKDYRYFLEADLPPLCVADWTDRIDIPELPDARRDRFRTEYGLGPEAAAKLTSTKQVADFYERIAAEFDPDLAATWVADNLLGELNYRDMAITDVADRLGEFARLVELVDEETIAVKNAEETVLRRMLDDGLPPDEVVEREDLGKTDDDAVAAAVAAAIDDNPGAVEDYHAGEDGALNFLVGQVMQETGGSADPGTVNELLRAELDG